MKDNLRNTINSQRSSVMGIAAIWIAVYHLWITSGKIVIFEKLKSIGFAGVDFFFLLSGMGLVYAIEKRSIWEFYSRRIKRVYLPFVVTGFAFKLLEHWSLELLFKRIFFISFYTHHVTDFLWFVPAILTLYLFFPFYYKIFKRTNSKGIFTLGIITIWFACTFLVTNSPPLFTYFGSTWMYLFINRIPIFLTGVYIGWLLKEKDILFPLWGWGICIVVFGLGLYSMELTLFQNKYLLVPGSCCFLPTYLIAISGVPLIAKCTQMLSEHGGQIGQLTLRLLDFFGKISLEFYCVHEYLGKKLKIWISDSLPRMITNFLMFAVSIVAALILRQICKHLCNCISIFGRLLRSEVQHN